MRLFAAMTRGMLAIGFIIAGYRKVGGNPFAPGVSTDTPIGDYFDAFWRTGEYYWFVGATQMVAGVLLLFPATCLLGAIVYFPIILNIFVLTLSLQFGGTSVVAGLMLLACAYLLCWEYDRWKGVIPGFGGGAKQQPERHLGPGVSLVAALGPMLGLYGAGATTYAVLDGRSVAVPVGLMVTSILLLTWLAVLYHRGRLSSSA